MNVSTTQETVRDNNEALSPSLGLAVGLPLSFLLIVIVAGVILYKYHDKMRNIIESARSRSQKKRVHSDQRTSVVSEHSASHIPIYENVTAQMPGYSRHPENHGRLPGEQEEDLYLQCDVQDNAIYSNDPQCNLVILQNSQEDDVYIIPDS